MIKDHIEDHIEDHVVIESGRDSTEGAMSAFSRALKRHRSKVIILVLVLGVLLLVVELVSIGTTGVHSRVTKGLRQKV